MDPTVQILRRSARLCVVALLGVATLSFPGTAAASSSRARLTLRPVRPVTTGHAATFRARLKGKLPQGRLTVALQRRVKHRWRDVDRARVGRKRAFRLRWTAPRTPQRVRVRLILRRGHRILVRGHVRTLTVRAASPAPPPALTPPLVGEPGPAPTSTTVVSDGRSLTVVLGALTVHAPAGTIARGQTLTLAFGTDATLPASPAPSIRGGPYLISTSQGEPAGPVQVTLDYRALNLGAGKPLLLHGLRAAGAWLPEPTHVDAAAKTATATLDTFSPIDWVNDVVYYGGLITGNRSELPDDCGPAPSWVQDVSLPSSSQQPLPLCFTTASDDHHAVLNVVNNRGYAQLVSITGVDIDVDASRWSDSIEGLAAQAFAALREPDSPQDVLLAPGGSAHITIDRPPDQPAPRFVTIDAHAKDSATAFAAVAWSVLATAREEIGLPVSAADCVIGSVYEVGSGDRGVESGLDVIHHCADTASAFNPATKEVFEKIAYGLAVVDFFYKLQDLEADIVFPASIGFTISGTGLVDSSIQVGPQTLGTIASGQRFTTQLAATGGTGPYSFRLYFGSPDDATPNWAELATDGTLTLDPPVGDSGAYTLHVYAFDATGRHDPFARDTVTFQTAPSGDAPPTTWSDPDPGLLPTEGSSTQLRPLACTDASHCVAGTWSGRALTLTRSDDGTWLESDPVLLPNDGYGDETSVPNGISCLPDGTCVIVGEKTGSYSSYGSFVTTMRDGAVETTEDVPDLQLPDGGGSAAWTPAAISCGTSSCTVVGNAFDADVNPVAMTGTPGDWNAPVVLPAPSDASDQAAGSPSAWQPSLVSCPGDGSTCVIQYEYAWGDPDHSGASGYRLATVTQTDTGFAIDSGAPVIDAGPFPASLACSTPDTCVSAWTEAGTSDVAMAATEVDGTWDTPAPIPATGDLAGLDGHTTVDGAACRGGGRCELLVHNDAVAGIVPWDSGTWGDTTRLQTPDAVPDSDVTWGGIWCGSDAACVALGRARTTSAWFPWLVVGAAPGSG